MFCSQCGVRAEGKFCAQCGAPLALPSAVPATVPAQASGPLDVVPADWADEVRYEAIMQVPEVRERVKRHGEMAPKRLSAEDLLGIYDKVVKSPVPMAKVAAVGQQLYGALGIGTGKQRKQTIAAPVGRTMVRLLCSLARNGQPLRNVRQAEDGCVLEASLPSDMFAMEGDLIVTVHRRGGQTEVEAATKIKGQLYDWGKSRRCLDRLYTDLQADAA